MIPARITTSGMCGNAELIARPTAVAAKIDGNVGPPRNPVLKATARRQSFKSARPISSILL